MSDLANLNNQTSAVTTINNNNAAIETALENTLSRDGTVPNSMSADLDMDGNDILNVGNLFIDGEIIEADTIADYIDWMETTEPSAPAANKARLYAYDESSVTRMAYKDSAGTVRKFASTSAATTDNAIARFDGTTGLLQDSGVTISDTGVVGSAKVTPTGASTARTLEARFAQVTNVKDFGALGDGSTNDTVAIAAAITAAGTGGVVYFPKGTYIFSDHDADGIGLTQLSGQRWYGDGRGSTILRLAAATTDIDVLITASAFATDYSIEDMQIDGNRENITPSVDLYNTFYMIRGPRGGQRGLYQNLHLANSWGRVLQTSDETQSEFAEDILVENVWVTNAGTKAISATRSNRVTIKGCFVEVDPYTSADHPGGVDDDDNASSGSCFECNESTNVVIEGNHGIQIGAVVTAPGVRMVNSCSRITVFGNTIEDAEYLGFIQNTDDVDFFGNTGVDIQGDAFIIADADGESGTCKRVRVHHNKVIDTDGAYVVITANNSAHNPEVECYIYDNDFAQVSGSPTHGIYNNGVAAPAVGGTCTVYQWNNRFTGTIPNQLAGPAAAQIRAEPNAGYLVLGQSSVAVSHTGNTNETTLATIAVPANRMGANGRVRVTAHWSYTNSANNKITRVRFGGSAVTANTNTTTAQQRVFAEFANRNALNSQIVSIPGSSDALGTTTSAVTTLAIDTTADRNVTITCTLADTGETITLESYVVELFHAV